MTARPELVHQLHEAAIENVELARRVLRVEKDLARSPDYDRLPLLLGAFLVLSLVAALHEALSARVVKVVEPSRPCYDPGGCW
jgi:hypothetical protein